jgi:hypothetical protein
MKNGREEEQYREVKMKNKRGKGKRMEKEWKTKYNEERKWTDGQETRKKV